MSFQFLHAADIHLDSPLLNLQRYDGAPLDAFRSATRRAFDNLVDLAIEQQVKFVIIAGDLYDGDCKDFSTPLHIRSKLAELNQANIRVVICQGNHDAQSHMRKAFRLQLPDNVHLLRTDRPETLRWDDLEIAIHGQGFAKREVTEDLSESYPSPVPGMINIGVLHTSCGPYETHQRYAPSSISGLTAKGYDYWALGHIHKRERLAGPQPFIVYPGNLQGRHIREDGPKGCELVRIQNGTITGTKFVPLDVIRWCRCPVEMETCESVDEIHEPVEAAIRALLGEHSPLPLAIRLELIGRTPIHRSLQRQADHWDRQLRTMVVDLFGEQVWLEKIQFHTQPPHQAIQDVDQSSSLGQLLASLQSRDDLEAVWEEVESDIRAMLKILPTDPRLVEPLLDLDQPNFVQDLLAEAKEILVSRLLESESV